MCKVVVSLIKTCDFLTVLVAVAVVVAQVPYYCGPKIYHGNMTSHLSSLYSGS